jgi:succinate dehydrogenase / fumarate reductase cytochrome b subunit
VVTSVADRDARGFLERHEFLIRRLHSLSGLVPVGAYMVVHLLTNASVADSPNAYQRSVYMIHSLGMLLPLVEWVFIFIPLLFHAIIGVVIVRGGLPNSGTYRYGKNVRYTLQRATGMIAFVFIVGHVFHMHGWFHASWWLKELAEPLGGAQFKPYNAASSLGMAMSGFVMPLLYAVGVLACVFHLANGIWTMGITWGVWISPAAQRRADIACGVFGAGLAVVSLAALFAAVGVDEAEARRIEDRMYEAKVAAEEISPDEHKRLQTGPPAGDGEHAAAVH